MISTTTKYLGYFTAIILCLLVLLVVYDATIRYLFSGGSVMIQELQWHLFDVIILFGIAYTLKENSHVRVDIFYQQFSSKTKALINGVAALFFIFPFAILIIYLGLDFVQMSFVQNETSADPGGLTNRYLVKALMPISFIFYRLKC